MRVGHEVRHRGYTFTVDDELLDDSKDRDGNSWLDLVDDDQAQIERWSKVILARGACPESVTHWNGPGDTAGRDRAREDARLMALAITDPVERFEALQRTREVYGRKPTSTSLGYVPTYDPSGLL
ncbi:hypothetical protein [Microbacterium testaceum]|nr:hypothetical protein [Microbacterium testaceum]